MKAIRIHTLKDPAGEAYSASNPAPPSALVLDVDLPIPSPSQPGEILIENHASTIIRDQLRWEETYNAAHHPKGYLILGHDLAGTVIAVQEPSTFKPGDEVYGMTPASRPSTWAEYVLVKVSEIALKPQTISWAEASAIPLSALTAWQGLFDVAGLTEPNFANWDIKKHGLAVMEGRKRVLITGASGGVGTYLVQLAILAKAHVTAATSSSARNRTLLHQLSVDEVIEYPELEDPRRANSFDVIIDTVGGQTLQSCWPVVKDFGTLASLDTSSYGFVEEHRRLPFTKGKENVRASWFLVHPSGRQLERIREGVELGLLSGYVAEEHPLAEVSKAYEVANGKMSKTGKVVLKI